MFLRTQNMQSALRKDNLKQWPFVSIPCGTTHCCREQLAPNTSGSPTPSPLRLNNELERQKTSVNVIWWRSHWDGIVRLQLSKSAHEVQLAVTLKLAPSDCFRCHAHNFAKTIQRCTIGFKFQLGRISNREIIPGGSRESARSLGLLNTDSFSRDRENFHLKLLY